MPSDLPRLDELGRLAQAEGAAAHLLRVAHVTRTKLERGPVGETPVRKEDDEKLVVEVWSRAGQRGTATGSWRRAEAIVRKALDAAERAHSRLPSAPAGKLSVADLGALDILDRRHHEITDDDRTALFQRHWTDAGKDRHTVPRALTYEDEVAHYAVRHSQGLRCEWSETRYAVRLEADLQAPEGPVSLRGGGATRTWASLSCMPVGSGTRRLAASLLPDAPPVDGLVRVLWPPHITARVLAWLAPHFAWPALRDGGTLLGRTGDRPQFSPILHVVDDGNAAAGLLTRPCDDEGVSPVPVNILREGMIAGRYLDVNTAREFSTRPTGHVRDGALRPANLHLRAGVRSINAQLGEQDRLVFRIDELEDLSAIDVATGDFALACAGRVYDRQTCLGARRKATVVGNLVHALKHVVSVTSDTDRVDHVDAAGLFVDGLAVHG